MRKKLALIFLGLGFVISCAHIDIPDNIVEIKPSATTDQKTEAENLWIEGEWAVQLESMDIDGLVRHQEYFTYRILYVNGGIYPILISGRRFIRRIELEDDKVKVEAFGVTRILTRKSNNMIEGRYYMLYDMRWPRDNRITMTRKK